MSTPSTTTPMSQRDKNRARTRRDIETAALEMFETQGYHATTVDQITRLAGCSNATFFRHFRSKEDVLFANDDAAARELARFVDERVDRAHTLGALAEPFAAYATSLLVEATSDAQRLTRLVMTTPDLEARSLRMRLKWEHAVSRTLASESDSDRTSFDDVLLASLAVSCLSTALWRWQEVDISDDVGTLTKAAFESAVRLGSR